MERKRKISLYPKMQKHYFPIDDVQDITHFYVILNNTFCGFHCVGHCMVMSRNFSRSNPSSYSSLFYCCKLAIMYYTIQMLFYVCFYQNENICVCFLIRHKSHKLNKIETCKCFICTLLYLDQ